ncbi:hypothetical protein RRG08_004323 [Elysia crispata]|uniref:Uncharacterized protein n=1 Tax=Elysia crispata TaxID=231223 RepID=A0AAE0YBY7_9GAST|nr:hypothetical protein RRG08_004323 [Elysia crispata]
MRLSELKETTLHGLRWNNSPTLSSTFICDWFTGSKCCVWLQGCPADLCIFLAYETQSVRLKQIKEILQHSKRNGQMVKSLTASLVSREEKERHQKNLNENEQLKKQIAESSGSQLLGHHCASPVLSCCISSFVI